MHFFVEGVTIAAAIMLVWDVAHDSLGPAHFYLGLFMVGLGLLVLTR